MAETYFVQVREKSNGEEYPLPLALYNLHSKDLEKLDGPPIHPQTGAELPVKPRTSVAAEAAKATPKSGQKAATEKENGR